MATFKIAVIVGSNRRESINRKLAQALAKLGARPASPSMFVQIDDLPLYNQDDEADLPASVGRFKAEIAAADGVLFVTPEHNRSIPAVLKNAIDWGARPVGPEQLDRQGRGRHRHVAGRDRHGARAAASAPDPRRAGRCAVGRRGLSAVQARADRRQRHCHRRKHAGLPEVASSTSSPRWWPRFAAPPRAAA